MKWEQIEQHWDVVSQQILITWGKLSEDDLAEIDGERTRFVTMMEDRYGYTPRVAAGKVDDFVGKQRLPMDTAETVSRLHGTLSRQKVAEQERLSR